MRIKRISALLLAAIVAVFFVSCDGSGSGGGGGDGDVTPKTVNIDCLNPGPNPVDEGSEIRCKVTASKGIPQIDATNNTCGGTLTETKAELWFYEVTPGEADGPGVCIAGVQHSKVIRVRDQATVNINEVNEAPANNAPAAASGDELTLISFDIAPTDVDIPAQSLTCSIITNTCPGGALNGCLFEWIPTEADGPNAGCNVVTEVSDGFLTDQATTVLTVNEAPVNNAPATASGNELTLITFDIAPTDNDIPAQSLTCAIVYNTCPGGSLNGCVFEWIPTEAEGPNVGCNVVTEVSDGSMADQATTILTVSEVNRPPKITIKCPEGVVVGDPINCTIMVNDSYDIPSNSPTCSTAADDTCGGTLTGCNNYNLATASTGCRVSVDVIDDGAPPKAMNDAADVELYTGVWFVDDSATGAGSGLSWIDAFTDVQSAMNVASNGEVIFVAEGVYTNVSPSSVPILTMKDGVDLFGGFSGTESSLSERGNPTNIPTILDGENTSFHVIVGASNVHLDGFFVANGSASGEYPNERGGGLYIKEVNNMSISNCVFSENSAEENGGGMYSFKSSMQLKNCVFKNNSAAIIGGSGGSIFTWMNTATMINNCTFWGGTAHCGAGFHNGYGAAPIINNSMFLYNSANVGGALYNQSSGIDITNCTFIGNTAVEGGAIKTHETLIQSKNCIYWGNVATSYALAISLYTVSTLDVSYSDIENSSDYIFVTPDSNLIWGTGMQTIDPVFNNAPIFWDVTTAGGTQNIITVSDGMIYSVGDVVEIKNDGIARSITAVSTYTVSFDPQLTNSTIKGMLVENWGSDATDLDEDFHLDVGSPCIDAGDPDSTYNDPDFTRNDMGAYGGPDAQP